MRVSTGSLLALAADLTSEAAGSEPFDTNGVSNLEAGQGSSGDGYNVSSTYKS